MACVVVAVNVFAGLHHLIYIPFQFSSVGGTLTVGGGPGAPDESRHDPKIAEGLGKAANTKGT